MGGKKTFPFPPWESCGALLKSLFSGKAPLIVRKSRMCLLYMMAQIFSQKVAAYFGEYVFICFAVKDKHVHKVVDVLTHLQLVLLKLNKKYVVSRLRADIHIQFSPCTCWCTRFSNPPLCRKSPLFGSRAGLVRSARGMNKNHRWMCIYSRLRFSTASLTQRESRSWKKKQKAI